MQRLPDHMRAMLSTRNPSDNWCKMTAYQNAQRWAIDQRDKARENFAKELAKQDAERERLALIIEYQKIVIGAMR